MEAAYLWAEYARIQNQADSRKLSDATWAVDEALEVLLDKIEKRQSISAGQAGNLIINRAAKHRHRRHSMARNLGIIVPIAANENSRLEAICELARHRQRCSEREWRIMISIGLGHTYSDIANAEQVPEATVKTWVRRIRLRLVA